MGALIATRASQNLATCNDTLKHMRTRENSYRLPKRVGRSPVDSIWERFTTQAPVRRNQFAGLNV